MPGTGAAEGGSAAERPQTADDMGKYYLPQADMAGIIGGNGPPIFCAGGQREVFMAKEIDWSEWLAPDASPTLWRQMQLVLRLSVPAILAEVSSIAMQYIDSAMVGSLGANATAAIGLVSTTTWLFGGLCIALVTGFSVQIAQMIGGGRREEAQAVLRQGLMAALAFGLLRGEKAAAPQERSSTARATASQTSPGLTGRDARLTGGERWETLELRQKCACSQIGLRGTLEVQQRRLG